MAELVQSQKKTVVPEKIREGDERFEVAQNDSPGEEKKKGGKFKDALRKAKEVAGEAKDQFREDFKEARGELDEGLKGAKKQIREDFGLKQKPEPRQGENGTESDRVPDEQEKKSGFAQKLRKGAEVILPRVDLGRGGHSAHEAFELADRIMNPQERSEANNLLRGASVLMGGKSLPIIPEGISNEVLNKVIEINFPPNRELTESDLKNLSPEEQKLVKHRMEVGRNIESSHELSDAEWRASIKNAEKTDYKAPADVNQKMMELEDYLNQQTGQIAKQAPSQAPSRKGGGAAVEQPAPGVSNEASTQYVAYVGGKQVSADLVASKTLEIQDGQGRWSPVVLNRDALARLEGAIAECGDITITSAFRDHAKQSRLHKDYLSGKNPYPVAQPGFSKHQSGFAIDISVKSGNQEKIHAAMTKAGFVRPIPASDPVHWVYVGPVSSGKNPVTS